MATTRQYRLSCNEICSPLKTFQSSRALVVSVRDAMEAHDQAYFDTQILHCNISIATIVTNTTGSGRLVDWDLCVDVESTYFRSMGTSQCMSAAVLRDPWRVQTIEDDRESAVHVLIWLALRYVEHDGLENVNAHLSIYDEVNGGLFKGVNFGCSMFPTFTSDPLDRLLSQVRETFFSRYTNKKYSDEEIRGVNAYVAAGKYDPIYGYPLSYIYGSHMDALTKPNWLVEVFNKHLESDAWPLSDKAVANDLSSGMGSRRKRTRS